MTDRFVKGAFESFIRGVSSLVTAASLGPPAIARSFEDAAARLLENGSYRETEGQS